MDPMPIVLTLLATAISEKLWSFACKRSAWLARLIG